MEITHQASSGSWFEALITHAKQHVVTAVGFAIAILAVLVLLVQSLIQAFSGDMDLALRYAMLGGLAGFAATAAGALPALALRGIPQKVEDSMLGLAAGMMLAASAFSLLLPGLEASEIIFAAKLPAGLTVVFGMA